MKHGGSRRTLNGILPPEHCCERKHQKDNVRWKSWGIHLTKISLEFKLVVLSLLKPVESPQGCAVACSTLSASLLPALVSWWSTPWVRSSMEGRV